MVFIISFVKIGPSERVVQNNTFFCFIVCTLIVITQRKFKPFIIMELNDLNYWSSLSIIVTSFLGFFISNCEDVVLEKILMTILLLLNFILFIMILKNYVLLKIIFYSHQSTFYQILKRIFKRIMGSGFFFIPIIFFFSIFIISNRFNKIGKIFAKIRSIFICFHYKSVIFETSFIYCQKFKENKKNPR